VTPQEAPQLHGVIDRLCALSDTPEAEVAVADTDVPNAFATGRSPDRAIVCVTTGLMRRLDPDELEGVLAHEMSHVAHRDVAVMTIASFLGVLAGLVVRFAARAMFYGGGRPARQRQGGAGGARGHRRLRRRLRDQLRADPGAVALPRAVGRPHRRAAHRPAVGARVGADEGHRRDGQGARPTTCAPPSRSTPSSSPRRWRRASACRRCSPRTRRWRSGSSSSPACPAPSPDGLARRAARAQGPRRRRTSTRCSRCRRPPSRSRPPPGCGPPAPARCASSRPRARLRRAHDEAVALLRVDDAARVEDVRDDYGYLWSTAPPSRRSCPTW
jgi:hypothetical protein